ncbi:MAG: CinA family nicotinamide mononucleotide deamidase-related protein [Bacteroidales bacterium]|nr:CinA family nicotinamide mononucleotide deamidase-related protein [Bacteroidales bacterium]
MLADIIIIGDEILIGQIVNTNAAWIGQKLTELGFKIRQSTSISDQEDAIMNMLFDSGKNAKLVVITGGIGPTKDDKTKATLAKYFNTTLKPDEGTLRRIEAFVAVRGGKMNPLNEAQAMVPANCEVIPNYQGTASGMWFEKKGTVFISMPGVPFEMKLMMEETILPRLKDYFKLSSLINKTLLIQGIPEAQLAITLEKWENSLPPALQVAYLPSPGYIRLRIGGINENITQLENQIRAEIKKLYDLIPHYILSETFELVDELLGNLLRSKKATVATAESCTGGNIAKMITSVSGSSEYFKGSVIAYSNEIKEKLLGVKSSDILKYGAVSQAVVEQMAKGVRELMQTGYAIATSGIAGPTGGTDEKPVGTTWIAVASKDAVISEKYLLGNLRETNIQKASVNGICMLIRIINDLEI